MRTGSWIISALVALAVGTPWPGDAGPRDLVGFGTVQDVKVVVLMKRPVESARSATATAGHGPGKMLPASQATHHLEVKALDVRSKAPIPYMAIRATITKLDGGQVITIEVPPMIGSDFHYGGNVALPGKGRYRIDVEIEPPPLMRSAAGKERWTATPRLSFDFDYQ